MLARYPRSFLTITKLILEALRERRPPWPRQIITPILSTVKMLSLGCERLPTPLKKKKKKKKKKRFWIITFTTIWVCYHYYSVFFSHLLILQYPDYHQNLISSYLYYSGPVHKISSQSVHNFLSNVVHRQTDRQTNATKNITSFAKEVTSFAKEVIIQIYSGITRGIVLNGERYAQRLEKLIYLYLFTDCSMPISSQSSKQI